MQFGDEGTAVARARYPSIAQPTFWRWVQAVRRDLLMEQQSAPSTPQPMTAQLASLMSAAESGGSDLDFRDQVAVVIASCDALLAQGWAHDATTGQRRVRNPMFILNSGRLRVQALAEWARREETLNSIARQKERFQRWQRRLAEVIGEVIADLDPALSRKVFDRFADAVLDFQSEMEAEISGGASNGKRQPHGGNA